MFLYGLRDELLWHNLKMSHFTCYLSKVDFYLQLSYDLTVGKGEEKKKSYRLH